MPTTQPPSPLFFPQESRDDSVLHLQAAGCSLYGRGGFQPFFRKLKLNKRRSFHVSPLTLDTRQSNPPSFMIRSGMGGEGLFSSTLFSSLKFSLEGS